MVILSPKHFPHQPSLFTKTAQSPSLQFGAESNALSSIPSEVPTNKVRKVDRLWTLIFGIGVLAAAIPFGELENLPSTIQIRKVGDATQRLKRGLPNPGATTSQPLDPQLFKNYLREIQTHYSPSQDVSLLAEYNQLLANLSPEDQAITQAIFTKANKIEFFDKKEVLSLYTEWLDKVVQPKTSPEFTAKLKDDAVALVSDATVNYNLEGACFLTSLLFAYLFCISLAGIAHKLNFNPPVFELQKKRLSPEDRGITEGALLKAELPEMSQPKNLLTLYGDWVDKVILPKTSPEEVDALKKQAVELSEKAVSANYPTQNLDAPLFLSFLMMFSLGKTESSDLEEKVKQNEKLQNEFVVLSGLRPLIEALKGIYKSLDTLSVDLYKAGRQRIDPVFENKSTTADTSAHQKTH
ncbi:MAG: hypothetical protein K2X66_08810 [Cyanobacteria bacterium]|nr:hypothetical protein [Cyanobacteriota bacterium]